MDYLGVLRDKIGRLRVEIASIQELNQQFRRDGRNGTGVQVAHGQRSEKFSASFCNSQTLAAKSFRQSQ